MASFRRQKEALRAALYAFIAGAHSVGEEVEKSQSISVYGLSPQATEARHAMLLTDYKRLLETPQSVEMLADILGEEELYPFGSEWPREAMIEIIAKIAAPRLSIGGEPDYELRFRKGFKKTLNEWASSFESSVRDASGLDHWMTLIINTAFFAGATLAARNAENPKAYYAAIQQIEEEVEAWGRYPQLVKLLDRQLARETRRRTGLVSDLDY